MAQFLSSITLANGAVVGGVFKSIDSSDLPSSGVVAGGYTNPSLIVDQFGRITSISNGSAGGTVTQVNTGTGLTGGPITTTGTVSLANTAVTPGSYTSANITVDAQGRITAAANGSGGGSPGGSDTYVQFNDSSTFGGSSSFTFDKTNKTLTVTNGALTAILIDTGTGGAGSFSGGSGSAAALGSSSFAGHFVYNGGFETYICDGFRAGSFRDAGNIVLLGDGTYAVNATQGSINSLGTSGNTYRWNTNVAAPSTQTLLSLPLNVYGAGTITDLLGDPDAWVLVRIGSTDYKLPAYL